MQLAGKVALVTGGGGGIGAGITEALVEHGVTVAISDINQEYAVAEAERIGRGVIALSHDVTSISFATMPALPRPSKLWRKFRPTCSIASSQSTCAAYSMGAGLLFRK